MAHVRRSHYNELGEYVKNRVKIIHVAGMKLHDLFDSHIRLAKHFQPECLIDLSPEQRQYFDERLDVHKSKQYWDIPLPDDPCFLANLMSEQVVVIVNALRMPYIMDTCMSFIQQCNLVLANQMK